MPLGAASSNYFIGVELLTGNGGLPAYPSNSGGNENLTTGSTKRFHGASPSSEPNEGSAGGGSMGSNQMGSTTGGTAGAAGSSAQMASMHQLCSTIQGM
jgi:hypothetical protein